MTVICTFSNILWMTWTLDHLQAPDIFESRTKIKTQISKKLGCFIQCKQRQNAFICKPSVFTDNGFTTCSQAHVVISFTQSCVSQSNEPCPIFACWTTYLSIDAPFIPNPNDNTTCYQWTRLPCEMVQTVFLEDFRSLLFPQSQLVWNVSLHQI